MKKSTAKPTTVKDESQTTLSLDSGPAWVVYTLRDPRIDDPVLRVRYVGFTAHPKHRLRNHIAEAAKGKRSHKCNWLRELLATGLLPIMETVDPGSAERSWANTEIAWIKHFRDLGCPLTNATDGGEGGTGHVVSAEARARMSAARKNLSPEIREKMSITTRKQMEDPAMRKRLSKAHMGKKQSPETRAKKSNALKGRVQSKDARENMKKAQQRRFADRRARG